MYKNCIRNLAYSPCPPASTPLIVEGSQTVLLHPLHPFRVESHSPPPPSTPPRVALHTVLLHPLPLSPFHPLRVESHTVLLHPLHPLRVAESHSPPPPAPPTQSGRVTQSPPPLFQSGGEYKRARSEIPIALK